MSYCYRCGEDHDPPAETAVRSPTDISPQPPSEEPKFLGDGVYATFDGYQIWLAVNDHRNQVVAIEPKVYIALKNYAKLIWGE
jgi:hypothetical protein